MYSTNESILYKVPWCFTNENILYKVPWCSTNENILYKVPWCSTNENILYKVPWCSTNENILYKVPWCSTNENILYKVPWCSTNENILYKVGCFPLAACTSARRYSCWTPQQRTVPSARSAAVRSLIVPTEPPALAEPYIYIYIYKLTNRTLDDTECFRSPRPI